MCAKKREEALREQAELLASTIKDLFRQRGDVSFSSEPEFKLRDIIEYASRMRADGMEKFNSPTFVSAINYYTDAKSMEKHQALGALVVYIEQDYVAPLLRKLKYPPIDDEDIEALKDGCGTLCNIISGAYKSALVAKGFIQPEMSHFHTYKNSASDGVEFCLKEWDKYEISFFIDKVKRLVVELTMGEIPVAK